MKNAHATLLKAVKLAGKAINELQSDPRLVAMKQGDDPLSEADLVANQTLKEILLGNQSQNTGWLSEETADDFNRLNCKYVWVVDPIDGTREFMQRIPEYAISVALIENEQPVLAAVFNPATNELFHAIKGEGAWLNEQLIHCNFPHHEQLTILASRSEFKHGSWQPYIGHHQVKPIGSIAYKLALVAAGRAHATFSLGPKSEWDIAAGVLLIEEAGGKVVNKDEQPFRFNQQHVRVNGIIAASQETYPLVTGLIHQATQERM